METNMQITKYEQSCLLVVTDERVALFDPGVMSTNSIPLDQISQIDDIIITHSHSDHFDLEFIKLVVKKFPGVVITAPTEVVAALAQENISATDQPSAAIEFFDAPHEDVSPMYPQPEEIGVHYLDVLTHPGDSHSFNETKAILALPITAPWGSTIKALNLTFGLKPQYVIPIHDWHWREEARKGTYEAFESALKEQGITFLKPETGKPLTIDI
jgi:L-ascorbate metabolism protein UlaG (beta-lactamase superfamily)